MSADESLLVPSDIKPTKLGQNPNLRVFVFEALGTMILSYGINCSQYVPPLSQKHENYFHDIFISLSLYLAIVICGPMSGAHCNPSVSLAFFVMKSKKMKASTFFRFVGGQLIGAIIGTVMSKGFFDCQAAPFEKSQDFFPLLSYAFGQMIGTFIFVFMILLLVHPQTTFVSEDSWIHIFIPVSLYLGRRMSYTVGGINPTVVLVFQLEKIFISGVSWMTLVDVLVLMIGSLIGAFLGSRYFSNHYILHVNKWQQKIEGQNE